MRRLSGFVALAAFGMVANSSEASELRFKKTAAGGITATGNALGLSKELDMNGPGTEDSIGTFATLDDQSLDDFPANANNPWFAGTTDDWTANGAEAQLQLAPDAQVLYAELIWGGSTAYGFEDVTGDLETPVTLEFDGDTTMVEPDDATALTLAEQSGQGFAVNNYMRSADVTEFVQEHGPGTYSVSGVPATQDSLIDSLNAAGWTLVVAYRDSTEQVKNLTIFVGGSFVDEDSTEDYDFAGFCTPPTGDFDGSVVISAIEGDADITGDSLAIAETDQGPFEVLSGPNNPFMNFFASQINGSDGEIDESGTYGDRNHDAAGGINVVGGRQSWDITEIPISSGQGHLSNDQTEAVIRTSTSGDSYIPTLAAFEIEVNAPDWSDGTGASVDPDWVELDGTSTVTVDMENVGLVSADGLVFFAPLPEGLELDSFSLDGNDGDIDGDPVAAADLESGVAIGDVGVDATKKVEFVVRAVAGPAGDDYIISPRWDYDYVMCVGEDALTEPYFANNVAIEFVPGGADEGETTADSGDTADAGEGESGSGDDGETGDTGGGTFTSGDAGAGDGDGSGCGCRTTDPSGAWVFGLLALLALPRRRQ